MLAQEIIRRKRDGNPLERVHIDAFVRGLVDHSWSDAQAAAMAMAFFLEGMSHEETVALTDAMTRSGTVLQWPSSFPGPILDKHSTGGVGDKVSLVLAPVVAACGGIVPMISGRGLGHTGGTLDKLDSIPGYQTSVPREELESVLRKTGCAIVGASGEIAPADRRLYAIRDMTATIESIPLICASILSKKLAAGLDAMVLDIKVGNGAFATDLPFARAMASALNEVAGSAGLKTVAWITDMNQVLGRSCGNALEVLEAVRFLQGVEPDPRLALVVRTLAAELLVLGRLEANAGVAGARVDAVLASGAALDHFGRMVAALGGATDFVEHAAQRLPAAPVSKPLLAARSGWIDRIATRELGLACVELGGGRHKAEDVVDPRVGFTRVAAPGDAVEAGGVLAMVHAASDADADAVCKLLEGAFAIADAPPEPVPILVARVGGRTL
ncbi:MAG: thymidine phosphorylase [Usitatibacter sp.]